MDLAQHEPDDADHTDEHGEPHHRMREWIRFDVREAEHKAAEAENRQADGEEVGFGGCVARAEITQAENRKKQRNNADDRQCEENRSPTVQIGLHTTQRGADRRRDAHGHADGAHRHATARKGVNRKYRNLQDRPHHAGADGFQQTADQNQYER